MDRQPEYPEGRLVCDPRVLQVLDSDEAPHSLLGRSMIAGGPAIQYADAHVKLDWRPGQLER